MQAEQGLPHRVGLVAEVDPGQVGFREMNAQHRRLPRSSVASTVFRPGWPHKAEWVSGSEQIACFRAASKGFARAIQSDEPRWIGATTREEATLCKPSRSSPRPRSP